MIYRYQIHTTCHALLHRDRMLAVQHLIPYSLLSIPYSLHSLLNTPRIIANKWKEIRSAANRRMGNSTNQIRYLSKQLTGLSRLYCTTIAKAATEVRKNLVRTNAQNELQTQMRTKMEIKYFNLGRAFLESINKNCINKQTNKWMNKYDLCPIYTVPASLLSGCSFRLILQAVQRLSLP